MIRRTLLALLALCFAGAALGQGYQPGRAPGFRPGFQFLSGGAAATSAWSATDKGSGTALSNNNTRAASTAGAGARGTKSSGTSSSAWMHFELTLIALVADGSLGWGGLYTSDLNMNDPRPANNNNTVWVHLTTDRPGRYYQGPNQIGDLPQDSVGVVYGFDYQPSTGNWAVSRNNSAVSSGTTAAGTSLLPGVGNPANSQTFDLNTGGSPFTSNPNNRPAWQ